MGTALLLYPNQLFDVEHLPKVNRVYLVEEPLLFGNDKEFPLAFHKQKLVLLRASMRRYAEEVLWPNGYEVEYLECSDDLITDTALVRAAFDGAGEIMVFDPIDDVLWKRLEAASKALEVHVPLRKLENPNFYLKQKDIDNYFGGKEKHVFSDFYQYQRERFDVLIDKDYKPFGGKWSFDSENRKKLPKDIQLPGISSFGDNDFVREAVTYVELKFVNNPGRTDTFMWPTNRAEAQSWLKDFFQNRFENFGPYEDAIDPRGVWLFHSALSPVMNIGLLGAREVVESALDYCAHAKKQVPLASLEGFIRQVLGWREYVRAMYVVKGSTMRTKNALGNKRKLTRDWYEGTTNILPVDDVIKKANTFAYAHHIERLMIMGNFMLLSDIHPDEVYKWFMEFFIDAYDWVMVPNIYGMSQCADGGTMTTKPYMSASNYILSMSSYEKDHWCDIWDGLFWRFVDSHRLMLKKNPRLGGLLIDRYDKMDASRKRIIGYRAQDFLDTCTAE
jgi:deoxyribodipyrimidine photolyase-related protein